MPFGVSLYPGRVARQLVLVHRSGLHLGQDEAAPVLREQAAGSNRLVIKRWGHWLETILKRPWADVRRFGGVCFDRVRTKHQ